MTSGKTQKDKHYIVGFDYLRVFAAFAVVWIHGSDPNRMARSFQVYTSFAVPCFILISFFLTQQKLAGRSRDTSYFSFMISRFQRLAPAYFAWSAGYMFLRLVKRIYVSHLPFNVDWISVLFCGAASYQLWFVPALLVWSAVFTPIMRVEIKKKPLTTCWGGILIFSGFFLLLVGTELKNVIKVPDGYEVIKHMAGTTGYAAIGMGAWWLYSLFGRYSSMAGNGVRQILKGFILMVSVLIVVIAFGGVLIEKPKWIFSLFYPTGVFLIFLTPFFPVNKLVSRYLAPCSFGIYLCHGIFVEGFQVMAGMGGWDIANFSVTFIIIMASFIVSLLLCVFLIRHRYTKWLVV